jgi:hypothetical protein
MKRMKACEPLFQPAYPNYPQRSEWKSFTRDAARKNITAYTTHRICDTDAIWFWDYVAERNRVVIMKLTLAGDLIYRISFEKPGGPWGYTGHIMTPTLKAENGYLYFEWWDTNQSGSDRHVKRAMKCRLREPLTGS